MESQHHYTDNDPTDPTGEQRAEMVRGSCQDHMGKTVLRWRRLAGITRAELARRAGLSEYELWAVEYGHIEYQLFPQGNPQPGDGKWVIVTPAEWVYAFNALCESPEMSPDEYKRLMAINEARREDAEYRRMEKDMAKMAGAWVRSGMAEMHEAQRAHPDERLTIGEGMHRFLAGAEQMERIIEGGEE